METRIEKIARSLADELHALGYIKNTSDEQHVEVWLREMLRPLVSLADYATHKAWCPLYGMKHEKFCTCGLNDIKNKVKQI